MKKWLGIFSSMKVGLALLAVFGVYAAAGSVLQPETYMHTPLFAFLGFLVVANMTVCTGRQLFLLMQLSMRKNGRPELRFVLRKAAVTFLHLGILIVLVGVYLSTGKEMIRFGMYIGQKVELSGVSHSGAEGTVTLRDFDLELDDNGRILQYRAEITVDGVESALAVNHPVRAGKGRLLFGEYLDSVTVRIWENGEELEAKIGNGDSLPLQSEEYRATLLRYVPDYTESDWMRSTTRLGENPKLVFSMSLGDEPPAVYVADFEDMIPLGNSCRFSFTETEPYVVLAYASDPGSIPVMTGSVLLLFSLGGWMLLKEKGKEEQEKKADLGIDKDG